jgi:large subunit ribosomal protein L3
MMSLLGHKGTMAQLYDEQGVVRPATAVLIPDLVVVRKRTKDVDGYAALQLGLGKISKRRSTKPVLGHFKKAGVEPRNTLREVRVDDVDGFTVGQQLTVELLQPGDKVTVTGTTRGRGFAGGVRRWGWHGGPATHGSMTHRRIGSLGSGTSPGRALKGRTLPGHYGVETVTVRGLRVVRVEPEKGIVYISGAVPGHRGSVVVVRKDS